ncbi:Hypothetical predicted protein [Octopus vulgaris]|uniref:Uncharacterized protein n=1 Tax=Octopus vulgaris TaxID=6645 RepID=A0AA36BGI0_OCTVU|nr:Hypothetical predicted protein [Octopus vulgaris]
MHCRGIICEFKVTELSSVNLDVFLVPLEDVDDSDIQTLCKQLQRRGLMNDFRASTRIFPSFFALHICIREVSPIASQNCLNV